jgi:hypothetical protein
MGGAHDLGVNSLLSEEPRFPGDKGDRMGHSSRRITDANLFRFALAPCVVRANQQQNHHDKSGTTAKHCGETSR